MGKLNLIYDARIIANGAHKDSGRSGIFFTALSLLKRYMQRDDISLYLYCADDYENIKTYLKKDFSTKKLMLNNNIKYIRKKISFESLYFLVKNLKYIRHNCKEKNNIFLRFILSIVLLFLSPLQKILCKPRSNFSKYNKKKYIYFSPVFKVPEEFNNCKKYILLHDLIPVLFPNHSCVHRGDGTWYWDMLDSLNENDVYFTNSNATRKDFLKYCSKINDNKIHTTFLASNEKFNITDINIIQKTRKKYNIPINKKYIFSLCTLEPRKNLIRAVKTFIEFIKKNNINDMVFVLGGGHWNTFIGELEKEISDLGDYKDKIIKAGYIDDEDLAPLYSGAEWFVYTSMYEGFGLPALEAMSCGCAVITSNNSSLPEVVGGAGIMIDWDSDEQHIEAYEKYYFNEELRKQNAQEGLKRAKLFSWERCVDKMIEVMKNAQ